MAVIGELKTLITARSDSMEKSLARVEAKLRRYDRSQKAMVRGMRGVTNAFKRGAASVVAMAAAYASVRTAVDLATRAVKLFASEQSAGVIFSKFFGKGAGNILNVQLREFAASTPFELTELRAGAKLLAAYTGKMDDLIPRMRMLGDIAAGSGNRLGDLIETYARNSQMVTQNTRDLREWGNRGVDVAGMMARQFGRTTEEIFKMASEGKIHFKDVQDALAALAGDTGKFGGSMSEIAGTLEGSFSNLQDSFDNVLTSLGGIIAQFLQLDTMVPKLAAHLEKMAFAARLLQLGKGAADAADQRHHYLNQLKARRKTLARGRPMAIPGRAHTRFSPPTAADREEMALLDVQISQLESALAPVAKAPARPKKAPKIGRTEVPWLDPLFRFLDVIPEKALRGRIAPLGEALAGGAGIFSRGFSAGVEGLFEGGRSLTPARDLFAGAAYRGSTEALAITQGATGRTAMLKETRKHTRLLEGVVEAEKATADAVSTGFRALKSIGSFLGGGED